MKNIILIAVAVLVLGAVGFIFFANSQNAPAPVGTAGNNTVTSSSPLPASTDDHMMQTNDKYIVYSSGSLEENTDKKRVLFFYANWCPTCIPADKAFQSSLSQIPEDVSIIRVNYNDTETDQEEKELATRYGVTYQHTFVQVDSQGNQITKWNGGDINQLLANLK